MATPDATRPMLTADQVTALAESLRALLAAVHDDAQMTASASTRARIEGALIALDVVLSADSTTALARLTDPSPDIT